MNGRYEAEMGDFLDDEGEDFTERYMLAGWEAQTVCAFRGEASKEGVAARDVGKSKWERVRLKAKRDRWSTKCEAE
jgi:hypothetical protein